MRNVPEKVNCDVPLCQNNLCLNIHTKSLDITLDESPQGLSSRNYTTKMKSTFLWKHIAGKIFE